MTSEPIIEAALHELDAATVRLSKDRSAALGVLTALGALWRLGASARARERFSKASVDTARIVAEGVATIDFGGLEASAVEILGNASRLDLVEIEQGGSSIASTIVRLIDQRDSVELALRGAELILGRPAALNVEQRASLAAYEATLRSELWRLVPLNRDRHERAEGIPPERRADFWWWCEGSDVPADALDQLGGAAHLLVRFPAARSELERRERVERAVQARAETQTAAVIPLGDWIRGRRELPAGSAQIPALAAGFAAGETLLVDRPDFQVSWQAPDRLVVDLVADGAPDRLPALVAAGRTLELKPEAGYQERYVVELDAPALAAVRPTLLVPLDSGDVRLELGVAARDG
jgi:hypothetical protein